MKKIIILIFLLFCFHTSFSQTIKLDGISFGSGAVIESKENFLDGGYLELGYSKIRIQKPSIFYSTGNEFLGKIRFQNSKSGNSLGVVVGYKYHFLGSLLSVGTDLEYLKSLSSKGGDFNVNPNFQINMFTPQLSVVCAYSINLSSNENVDTPGRILLGLRYVHSFKRENSLKNFQSR